MYALCFQPSLIRQSQKHLGWKAPLEIAWFLLLCLLEMAVAFACFQSSGTSPILCGLSKIIEWPCSGPSSAPQHLCVHPLRPHGQIQFSCSLSCFSSAECESSSLKIFVLKGLKLLNVGFTSNSWGKKPVNTSVFLWTWSPWSLSS